MSTGIGEGRRTPEWFELGRSLLIALARRSEPDDSSESGSDIDDPDRSDPGSDIALARTRFADHLAAGGQFATIAANAVLTVPEAEVLALLCAAESDRHCQRLVAAIQGDARHNRLTLGTIADAMGPEHVGALALAPESALRRSALVDVVPTGPWSDHVVELHRGVVWALVGDDAPDPDLPFETEQYDVGPSDDGAHGVVVVNGSDPMRRRQRGAEAAVGERFLFLRIDDDTTPAVYSALVREATMTGRGVVIETDGSLPRDARRWIERATHLAWVVSSPSGPPVADLPRRIWHGVEAGSAEPTDAEWAAAFGRDAPRTHRLTFDQMHRVASARDASGGDIDAAVRRLASGRLEQLTRRIKPTRGWNDIVLSPDRMQALHGIVDRYRMATTVYDEWGFSAQPSRGLVALFSGPSGTGKTLAAEIIAGALGLDVFKLDLSSVVSKYIGETEKNLEQIFDAASAANMVLFFDEADSLFGKRSEVKDARDRYANIEVSYLLQRLETYDGLVVMATNFEKNVDEAFLRRIHARVAFTLPGVEERAVIWRQNLPPGAPTDEVDVEWLASTFELSGGMIRNAAVQAAFAAATAGSPITMAAAVQGVASELRKMGRLLRPDDFGEHFDLVTS